jgi:ketosteroid isomerase-like protein
VRASIEAFNSGGIEAALEFFHPEIEWETTGMYLEAGTYRGHDGIRQYMGAFDEEFDDVHFELAEVLRPHDPAVYRVRLAVVGRHSRAPVTIELHVVARGRDGKVYRQRNFQGPEDALKAAESF